MHVHARLFSVLLWRRADARLEDTEIDSSKASTATGDKTTVHGKSGHDTAASNPAFFEHESTSFFSSMKPSGSSSMAPQILAVAVVVALVFYVLRRRANSDKELHEKSLA